MTRLHGVVGPLLLPCALLAASCDVERWRPDSDGVRAAPSSVPVVVQPLAPAPPSQVVPPAGAPKSFADLAAQADPGVVFVRTAQAQRVGFRRVVVPGTGSGFVFDASGLILTNFHVVNGAHEVVVEMFDGRAFPARTVGADPLTDVAVLRVQAQDLAVLPLGDSDAARVGDWVLAIGNPYGLAHTVSAGIISARDRTDVEGSDPRAYYNFLQTDASINPGNSGGPLLDMTGRVIGINTAINKDANSIGFAIPASMVRELLPRLLKDGVIQRAAIGVEVAPRPSVVSDNGLGPREQGALITGVLRNGPAHRAGMLPGDIVIEIDGQPIESPERLRWRASLSEIGQPISIVVLREKQRTTLTVVPAPQG